MHRFRVLLACWLVTWFAACRDGGDAGESDNLDCSEGAAATDDESAGDSGTHASHGSSSDDSSDDGSEDSADDSGSGGAVPTAELVELVGEAAGFDDLRYSPELGRVLAVPQGQGTVYLVDPDSLAVTGFDGLPSGIASIDAGMDRLFVADRGDDRILVLLPGDGSIVGTVTLGNRPDYVRVSSATSEVWVTEPSGARIEVLSFDGTELAHAADIDVPGGPEGVVFDTTRQRAFAQLFAGSIVAIDVDGRVVVDTWSTECGGAHGIPVVDEMRGFVFAGCSATGGGVVLDADDGEILARYDVGSGEAILGYAPALGHFYLRGDPGNEVAMLEVCDDGSLGLLATVTTATHGHGMTADDRGNVWVCDADHGGLLRIVDPA